MLDQAQRNIHLLRKSLHYRYYYYYYYHHYVSRLMNAIQNKTEVSKKKLCEKKRDKIRIVYDSQFILYLTCMSY